MAYTPYFDAYFPSRRGGAKHMSNWLAWWFGYHLKKMRGSHDHHPVSMVDTK
jgi:hypothetical protein